MLITIQEHVFVCYCGCIQWKTWVKYTIEVVKEAVLNIDLNSKMCTFALAFHISAPHISPSPYLADGPILCVHFVYCGVMQYLCHARVHCSGQRPSDDFSFNSLLIGINFSICCLCLEFLYLGVLLSFSSLLWSHFLLQQTSHSSYCLSFILQSFLAYNQMRIHISSSF